MSVQRIRLISARAPFRRGGVVFAAAGQPVEITELALGPAALLAILREPVLTVQVWGEDDSDWEIMKRGPRQAFAVELAHLVDRTTQTDTPSEAKIEGAAGDPAGGPGDAGQTSTFDGRAPLGTYGAVSKVELTPPPPANATATAPAREPKPAKPAKAPKPATKPAG